MKSVSIHWLLPLGFFFIILYIIFLADTASYNFAFHMVGTIPYGDKICHALLYGILALLVNHALRFQTLFSGKSLTYNLYLGSIAVFVFALIEEISQIYLPSRTFDIWDIIADIIGIWLISSIKRREYVAL